MRLSKLKLSGFKSFVDPTSVNLPSSLVGIVGPNGCGKSNTIDAVRWVMGESSAKNLRGESMDDVIFGGSSTRKPVGQASVELVFDNSDGSLGGEYAAYAEIGIRREVTRDGQSKYFLNNARCRRRDIRDIFLGTGLGPRSYAIIEQGMISRLIEAKPEDMRVFLEEAAGISKYKERRRETENRIRHTRDNLDRLDDLREEVEKQIAHLKRQANTAERYRVMKADENVVQGQLLCLRWQDFQETLSSKDSVIGEQEVELEEIVAEQRAAEASIEQDRQNQTEATEGFNRAQADFYKLGSEVTRIEQSIAHTRESRAQQNSELRQIEESLSETEKHLVQDQQRIEEIDASMQDDEPAWDKLQESQKYSAEMLAQAEAQLQEWQSRWDEFSKRNSEANQTAQVELSRMDQLERGVTQLDKRIERVSADLASLDIKQLSGDIETWIADEVACVAEEERLQNLLSGASDELQQLRESHKGLSQGLDETRNKSQSATGRLASLEALQQASLGRGDSKSSQWLQQRQLDDRPRLAQELDVDAGWEKAVELVLGSHLDAVFVEDVQPVIEQLTNYDGERLSFIGTGVPAGSNVPAADSPVLQGGVDLLANKVRSRASVTPLLTGVYCVSDLNQALEARSRLGGNDSIVTRDGYWLGVDWIRAGESDLQDGVLEREQEITNLQAELKQLEQQAESQQKKLDELDQKLEEHESRRDTLQHSFNQSLREVSEVKSRLASANSQVEQLHARDSRLNEELAEAKQIKQQDEEQIKVSLGRRTEALELINQLTTEGESLQEEQGSLKERYDEARERSESERSAGQEIAIRVESMRTARVSTEQNLERMKAQLAQYTTRREELNKALATEEDDPVALLEKSLAGILEAHVASESTLNAARTTLEQVEQRLRAHEQARVKHDSRASAVREAIQTMRLESQEARVRVKTIDEQLQEGEFDRQVIVDEMPEEANSKDWGERLQELERKIQRLGPINLAAIDEYDQQIERKDYLDSQHADVVTALETLEKAIGKIDRETRARFKETFDKVNQKVQEFFPRLFGGGQATLEMTGDDLLDTGVTVLAQPPGKHVTNIHLLSGGEKALTAVAVVFAFFELNPSPFCMLDEVDAPLDDANVGRFCELVKEMSERVQFIIITHNKVTMELSNQLLGVTMNEPGCSRLVAVDVQEAVELAGA